MAYTKKDFGRDLLIELSYGYNFDRIARWADKVYFLHLSEFDDDLNTIVQNIASMSFGEPFLVSESDLYSLAQSLIREELDDK